MVRFMFMVFLWSGLWSQPLWIYGHGGLWSWWFFGHSHYGFMVMMVLWIYGFMVMVGL